MLLDPDQRLSQHPVFAGGTLDKISAGDVRVNAGKMIQHHISCDVYTQHLYAVA
jgi:hypothetical protein